MCYFSICHHTVNPKPFDSLVSLVIELSQPHKVPSEWICFTEKEMQNRYNELGTQLYFCAA